MLRNDDTCKTPAGEYPALPDPRHRGPAVTGSYFDAFTADQMRAYIDADRAMRAQAAPAAVAGSTPDGLLDDDGENRAVRAQAAPTTDRYVQPVPDKCDRITWRGSYYHLPLKAPQQPAPAAVAVVEQEELREGASYESMNLAVMVLSDCGHSSNYKPLLERVAGRIDRHVERLLTAQHADRAMRAQAAPAAAAGQSQWVCKSCGCEHGIAGEPYWTHDRTPHPVESVWRCDKCDATHEIKLVEPTTQAAPQPAVQQGDGGTDIGPLGQRTILDAIRSAYDLGYNDARNACTHPGDSAPGYKGRNVEKDHGGALIARLNVLATKPQPSVPARGAT